MHKPQGGSAETYASPIKSLPVALKELQAVDMSLEEEDDEEALKLRLYKVTPISRTPLRLTYMVLNRTMALRGYIMS